jgi:virginiamycin B lyase
LVVIASRAACLLLVIAIASACSSSPENRGENTESRETPSVASPSGPRELFLEEELQAELTIDGQPDWIASGYGSIWVAVDEAATVDRIDPQTNEVSASIKVGDHPCDGLVAAFGSVWVPSCTKQALYRVSAKTEKVEATIEIPIFKSLPGTGPFGGLAAGEGAVWIVTAGKGGDFDQLARIDPSTNSVTDTIDLGHLGGGVVSGGGLLWVSAPEDGMLLAVDPRRGKVIGEVSDLAQPSWVAYGEGGVWVLSGIWSDHPDGDGSVTRIDPETYEVVATIPIDERPGQPSFIAAGNGSVWVRSQYTLLARIDPTSNTVVERYADQKGLGGIVIAFDSVWLSDFAFNRVWRLPL